MPGSSFPTTRRSVVLALSSADADERARAFETLVALYWKPLYKYARLAGGWRREEGEDVVQAFFARMLERESLASYDVAKASFRTFLRTLFDRFAANERKAGDRLKRGGGGIHLDFEAAELELGREVSGGANPEELFQREWARSVFALAIERLRAACEESGKQKHFAIFEAYDLDEGTRVSYRELAERFSIPETTVTNHLAATRRRFRELVLEILREATASEQEFRAEARALLGVEK